MNTNSLAIETPSELTASNANSFRDEVRSRIQSTLRCLDLNLAATRFIDSSGLGALLALHKTLCAQEGAIRLVNPSPQVQQVLELTRMHRLLEIVQL